MFPGPVGIGLLYGDAFFAGLHELLDVEPELCMLTFSNFVKIVDPLYNVLEVREDAQVAHCVGQDKL